MEKLYAEFLLWVHRFHSGERYEELLDEMFLSDLNNEFLLELEECSTNLLDTTGRFMHYWTYEHHELDVPMFGKYLFSGLELAYKANDMNMEEFGRRCYLLWRDLPPSVDHTEPFLILCYADDCLSYGDEAQTRSLYEKAFAFYD